MTWRHEVGAYLHRQVLERVLAHGPARWLTAATPSETSTASRAERLQQRPHRHAARGHDDQLAVAVEAVENVDGGDQQGDRGDQGHHAGNGQRGHGQEAQHVLALRGHQLELAQGDGDPGHAGQRDEDEHQRTGRLPQFFSVEEFRVVTRFVEVLLGNADATALSQATQWFDQWLYSAAGVRAAAQHLDPLHRLLAVAVNGEESVRDLETADPQSVVRGGLAALHDLSLQAHGQEFLQLTASQQIDLLTSSGTGQLGNPLRKFFEITRAQAIRGYYTSAAGLEELDYKGNTYYGDSPGCEAKS